MIPEFVAAWEARKTEVRAELEKFEGPGYIDIVRAVVRILSTEDDYDSPDPGRIHQIDDGDYQGMFVFVIAAKNYQPSQYWYVQVNYGSCSGCDTLASVLESEGEVRTDGLMTLALHILQGLKAM